MISSCRAHKGTGIEPEDYCRPLREVHSNTLSSGVAGDAATSDVCGDKTGRFCILDIPHSRVIDCSFHWQSDLAAEAPQSMSADVVNTVGMLQLLYISL